MADLIQGAVTAVLFFLILGVLVLIHELGHFVTARLANVRVMEFGVGFPPRARILGRGKVDPQDVSYAQEKRARALAAAGDDVYARDAILDQEPEVPGGTIYSLNWLPIGGFVKLEGEDGDEADDPRSFAAARTSTKLIILAAGVVMNLITAFLIFTVIAWLATPVVGLRFSEVQPDSPAAGAGLVPGEAILAVNGVQREFLGESGVLTDLQDHVGETVTLTVQRPDGSTHTVDVALRTQSEIDASPEDDQGRPTKGPLGISGGEDGFQPVFYGTVSHDLPTAIQSAGQQTVYWFGLILAGLGDLVSGFVNNPGAAPPVSGPVGIAIEIRKSFFEYGPLVTLYVAGVLSANLALVNSLPFPPLDGGRALMIVLKKLFGARISLRAERLTYVVGFVVLFAFLIWVTGFDILRALNGEPT